MKVTFSLILIFALIQIDSVCQSARQTTYQKVDKRAYVDYRDSVRVKKGEINITQDERIEELDELRKKYPGTLNGYRVQIFFGKRELAIEQKAEFVESNPDVPTYISFLAPNFRLRVGDFRSRIEAEKLKSQIEKEYPGCYIVKDQIELPPLEKEQIDFFQMDSLKTKTDSISAE
ncbi:MAG: SPOR domain-containing protein [Bacteroidota bacterium]